MFKFLKRLDEKLLRIRIRIKNEIIIKSFKGIIKIEKSTRFNQLVEFYGEGKVIIGKENVFGYRFAGGFKEGVLEIQTRAKNAKIIIGDNLASNNNILICAKKYIQIGNNVLIGRNVTILDHNAHGINSKERRTSSGTAKEIIIKDNVWLGSYVTVLPGTIIGKNSIVGVNSVVKGEFPENVIISGNPAKIIKKIKEVNNEKV